MVAVEAVEAVLMEMLVLKMLVATEGVLLLAVDFVVSVAAVVMVEVKPVPPAAAAVTAPAIAEKAKTQGTTKALSAET